MSGLQRRETKSSEMYKMHIAGYSTDEIAEQLNTSPKEVTNGINKERERSRVYLTEVRREERMLVEAERLDMMQSRYWDVALQGDLKAAELILKIMDRRAKLFGFDVREESHGDQYIIVTGDSSEEFSEILRRAQKADRNVLEGKVLDEDDNEE